MLSIFTSGLIGEMSPKKFFLRLPLVYIFLSLFYSSKFTFDNKDNIGGYRVLAGLHLSVHPFAVGKYFILTVIGGAV